MSRWLGIVYFALADLRGDLRRFGILIACLALGVGTIAIVGAVGASFEASLSRDARVMLGGDLQAQLSYRPAEPDERALFARLGRVSEVVDFLARASFGQGSAFITIRAVDASYPLLGTVQKSTNLALPDALGDRQGNFGVFVAPLLLEKLGARIGDRITIGDSQFVVAGTMPGLPDAVSQDIIIGYPVLMSLDGMRATGIVRPGGLARYSYKILLNPDEGFASAADKIRQQYPEVGWQITGPHQATADLDSYFDLFRRFLVIVGLSALLVGGIGVANAIAAYIADRRRTIATMKALGATGARVLAHFLTQAMLLVVAGIVVGVLLGVLLSLVLLPVLGPASGLPLSPAIDWPSMAEAAGFGLLVGFAFAYVPLQQANATRPAVLFRAVGGAASDAADDRLRLLRPGVIVPMALAAIGVFAMAALVTARPDIVLWYAIGASIAFGLLSIASMILQAGLRRIPTTLLGARTRNALRATTRPGSPAASIVLSLGLGLGLLILLVTIGDGLRHQLDSSVRVDAPDFIYLDLFEDETAALQAFATTEPRIAAFRSQPVLRSPTLAVNGVIATVDGLQRDISMFFGGETPLTTSADIPAGNFIVEGQWWVPDYDGPPLVSVTKQIRDSLKLRIGDRLTFNLFGEDVSAEVASVRQFDWQRGRVNFPFVLSPNAFAGLPISEFAFITAAPGQRDAVERLLGQRFPELVFLPVDEALASVTDLVKAISGAIVAIGAVAVASGGLALAGALTSGRRQRESDAVVAKVLGATRGDIVASYLIEYGLVGGLAGLLATGLGLGGAWVISTQLIQIHFGVDPLLLVLVIGGALAVVVGLGAVSTWSALSVRPAQYLRDEGEV